MEKTALITGATSGIGKALAFELASRGYRLGLAARRSEVLSEIRSDIEAKHEVDVFYRELDVQDSVAVYDVVEALASDLGSLKLAIANSGIVQNRKIGTGSFEKDRATIETNLIGAMATVDAAAAVMKSAGGGQIVGISSVAAYRGLPGLAAYSASKAGLALYLEAVRAELQPFQIGVTCLFPGYIDTPLNQDMRSRPFLVTVEEGAKRIADLIERGVSSSAVPTMPWNLVGLAMRATPDFIWNRVMAAAAPSTARDE